MALKKAGGFGYYQRLATFIIVSGYALMGAVIYGLLFFLLFPNYHCLVKGTTDQYETCSRKDICDGENAVREYKLNYSENYTLHNWVEQMDLTCVSNSKIAWLGSIFLIVQSFSYLLTPLLIKAINIKNAWLLLAFVQFVTYLLFIFVKDINLALFITAIYGLSGARCAFSYTFLA